MQILKDLGVQPPTLTSTYKKRMVLVKCPICLEEFKAIKNNITRGITTKCATCRNLAIAATKAAKSASLFSSKASAIHNNLYSYENVVYVNNSTKVNITCKVHGDFSMAPNNHLQQKQGCPVCSGNVVTTASLISKLQERTSDVVITGVYLSTDTKISCKCNKCGAAFISTPHKLLSGYGCKACNKACSDYNTIYLWQVIGTDLFKFGVTSTRLEDKRIKTVASKFSKLERPIKYCIHILQPTTNALYIEKLLKRKFPTVAPDINPLLDGKSEFRYFTPEKLLECKAIITNNIKEDIENI